MSNTWHTENKEITNYENEQLTAVDKVIAVFEIGNQNPLQKDQIIDMPLTIKQDQIEKQVVNTFRDIPDEMYKPPHLLIESQDKLSVFRKHIPQQQEIDALLQYLRKRVLHDLMVNLDTKDLAESYTTSLRYNDIYNYITDGRLAGNMNTQKKITGEAGNYVVVNDMLFKILQYKESGKWVYYLPLVIPEKFETHILNICIITAYWQCTKGLIGCF